MNGREIRLLPIPAIHGSVSKDAMRKPDVGIWLSNRSLVQMDRFYRNGSNPAVRT